MRNATQAHFASMKNSCRGSRCQLAAGRTQQPTQHCCTQGRTYGRAACDAQCGRHTARADDDADNNVLWAHELARISTDERLLYLQHTCC